MKATAQDLRFRSRALLEAVDRGQEVLITYRGRPRARLVGVRDRDEPKASETKLFGMWRDHEAVQEVDSYVPGLRRPRS